MDASRPSPLELRREHAPQSASVPIVRIHRPTIVNLQRIRDTRPASHGDHIVVLHDGTQLQMSRANRERLDGSAQ